MLAESIASVRAQTYVDWELIVVGDRCTDDSATVVSSFGDPRIRWFNREANSGSQALPNNDAIAAARGEYIAYLGHDDLWHPTHLQRLVAALEGSGADIARAVLVMLGPAGSHVAILQGLEAPASEEMVFVAPTGTAHRRDLTDRIGPWRDHREIVLPPDQEFQRRAWSAGAKFVGTGALTAFKFNAAYRPGCYAEGRADEQQEFRQLMARPGFMSRVIARIMWINAIPFERATVVTPDEAPDEIPPGWVVDQWRRIKGAA